MKAPFVLIILLSLILLPGRLSSQTADRLAGEWAREYQEIRQVMQRAAADPLRLFEPGTEPQVPVAHPQNLIWSTDRHPADVTFRRTAALLEALGNRLDTGEVQEFASRLKSLQPGESAGEEEFLQLCRLRREIVLSNPLLNFEKIIYSKGGGGWAGGLYHMAPYMGFSQQVRSLGKKNGKYYNKWSVQDWQGGFDFTAPEREEKPREDVREPGLFVAQDWESGNALIQPLLEDAVIANGRHAGKVLNSFPGEHHFAFDLSFDGKEVVFARALGDEAPSHIYRATLGENRVHALTHSWFADWDPAFLPNGRIVFVSLRRWITARCQSTMPQPCGTLFSMAADGSDLFPISWHETSEMFPVVDNDGKLVYSRWDYIDRGTVIAHNLWTCFPDGRDPRAPHGNYGHDLDASPEGLEVARWLYGPHTVDLLKKLKGKNTQVLGRPLAEFHIRPIPGRNGHYVAVAGIHHGAGFGSLVLIDTNIPDDGFMSQVRIIRGDSIPAEFGQGSENKHFPLEARWVTPWPLSEQFFLATMLEPDGRRQDSAGIYVVDVFGNRELLVADNGLSARPLEARPKPPVLPTLTWQGERQDAPEHKRATISVIDAYRSDQPWPEDASIKELRVIQVLPIPWGGYKQAQKEGCAEDYANNFKWGPYGYPHGRACLKAVLGTVPVEKDGSAYFEAPVGKQILFQALDENGMALQTMRTGTYVHPGEQMSCVGCHRTTSSTPATVSNTPLAMMRPPSKIQPEPEGSLPLNYHRLVRPVVEKSCIPCHKQEGKGFTTSEVDVFEKYVKVIGGVGAPDGTGSTPGEHGAYASKLGKILLGSHKDKVSEEDRRKLIVWMDANALELGALYNQPQQRKGEIVWPLLDMDPKNPQGIEHHRPAPQ